MNSKTRYYIFKLHQLEAFKSKKSKEAYIMNIKLIISPGLTLQGSFSKIEVNNEN